MKLKMPVRLAALVWLLLTFNTQLSTAFAQGSLTPPGPPAPTMLALSQVEPRTPISSVPFTITQHGSYYLATNLVCSVSNAITIAVSGVSLDLNGFTISSTVANAANGGAAIFLSSGLRNITIVNGFIQGGVTNNGSQVYSGSGFNAGIYYLGNAPENVQIFRVSISGCLSYGIFLEVGDTTLVESCMLRTIGGSGIYADTVERTSVLDCGGNAIEGDLVSDCVAQSTGSGTGIYAALTVLNSSGSSVSGYGIDSDMAQNSLGYGSGAEPGIYVSTIATGCYGYSSTGYGIDAYLANACYSNNGDSGISFKYNMP